jgi:hypothetical protein
MRLFLELDRELRKNIDFGQIQTLSLLNTYKTTPFTVIFFDRNSFKNGRMRAVEFPPRFWLNIVQKNLQRSRRFHF